MNDEVTGLADELPDAELVFAVVSPLGTPSDVVQEALADALRAHDYEIGVLVRISTLLDGMDGTQQGERPAARQERLMDAGSRRRDTHGGDFLALSAIATINASRTQDDGGATRPHKQRAHLIRSLKHPEEVAPVLRSLFASAWQWPSAEAKKEGCGRCSDRLETWGGIAPSSPFGSTILPGAGGRRLDIFSTDRRRRNVSASRTRMPEMQPTPSQPRTLTLKEVLEGAERAEQRVSAWPQWKKELSVATRAVGDSSRGLADDPQVG